MREIKGEEVTKTSRQFDCSLNCALIVLEFDELDQSLSLQDRLIFAWRRSMCFAGYDEFGRVSTKPTLKQKLGSSANFEKKIGLPLYQ